VITGLVETSGENPGLAQEEVGAAVRAIGGRLEPSSAGSPDGLLEVQVPTEADLAALARRLALARRVLVPIAGAPGVQAGARGEGERRGRAAFRRLGSPGASADEAILLAGRAYVEGGGTIDLLRPERRYWLAATPDGRDLLLREVAGVPRSEFTARAMPRLPFRRPVSLPPRLARAATNLAGVGPGDRVLDPFVGTGALLAEAALLGARVYGIDADPQMLRGALRNFAHLGVRAEELVEGDARSVDLPGTPPEFEALVTDPPYGRSSASVGADPSRLVQEVLARWAPRIRPLGPIVVLLPGGPPALPPPWIEELRVPVRVHRSLTREFCRYRRAA